MSLALTLAIFSLISLSTSCSSIPSPNTGNGTLLAIPILRFSSASATSIQGTVSYNLNIEHVDTKKNYPILITPTGTYEYRFADVLPEGKYRLVDYEPLGLINAKRESFPKNKELTIEKGKITIFPYKLVTLISENKQTGRHYYGLYFFDIDDSQNERIKTYFKENPAYGPWFSE